MNKYIAILFLAALTAVQGIRQSRLTQPHPDCPFGIHHLLPHEYDCTKFYYCEWGERFIVPTNCAPGTEFSFTQQVCTHPWFSDCNLPGSPTSSSSSSTVTPSSTTSSSTTTTSTTSSSTTSPSTTTSPTTTSTTTTSSTTSSTTTSPSTTTSSTTTSTTTTPSTTTSSSTTSSTTTSTTTTPSSTTSSTTSSSTTPEDDGYLDNGCPANFDIHKLLPHETSCRKYYFCDQGEKILRTCDAGLIFNPAIEDCDDPANTDRTCEDSSEDEEDPEDPEHPDDNDLLPNGCPAFIDISISLPHQFYCSKSYQCVFGQKSNGHCPAGTDFNYGVKVAVSDKKSLKKKFVKILICVTC